MPFDFVFISIIFVWCVFYLKSNIKNFFLFLGLMFTIVSYFNLNMQLFGVSFNISIIFGVLCWTIFINYRPNSFNIKLLFKNIIVVLILYVGMCLLNIELNSFFNIFPLILLSMSISLITCRTLKSSLCVFTISNIVCEIFNVVLLMKKINMAYMFCREFVISMVIGISIINVFYFLKRMMGKVRYEKIS